MTPTKIYTFIVPAGGSYQLQAVADYFKIMSATGDIEVRGDTFGTVGNIRPGQGLRGVAFGRLEVRDLSGFENRISVLVSGADFVDERISGSVEVVDGGKNRSLAGAAFVGYVNTTVLAAGNRAHCQIYNPVGSGKNAFLKSLLISSTVAQFVGLTTANVAGLGALVGKIKGKRLSAADGACQLREISQIAYLGLINYTGAYVPALGNFQVVFQEPLVIEPGQGFSVSGNDVAVGSKVAACFETYEESIL